jgi:Proline racemase/WD domain, G-beta repeat
MRVHVLLHAPLVYFCSSCHILALVCAVTATARSEGAPFLMLDTGGHQANICSMAYTPDGRYLISAGDDKAVRVWDLKENKAVRTIRRQSGPGDEGKIDRSPTRTDCSARMAVLIVRGLMVWGDVYRARSIIGSEFVCRIARQATVGGRPAIVPLVSDRAWITGANQYMLDPADPWPRAIGLRIRGRVLGRQFERFARFARLS